MKPANPNGVNGVVALPRVYLVRMTVFVILAALVALVLFRQIEMAFMANPGLNGLIVFVLLLGIIYAARMVWRLFPEARWINGFRIADPGHDTGHTPRLLAPMATLLSARRDATALSPQSMRSLLDSLASRLDESRDISRYLIGLLIFLGLLGTFWGLLQTVSSVGVVIRQLDVTTAESSVIFEELKSGLEAPLAGMGTSFSSSLFGLAGSLVLGFLDLQASQAQNRFYNELEEWLSSITDIKAGDDTTSHTEALDRLAGVISDLVQHMRQERQVLLRWVDEQARNSQDGTTEQEAGQARKPTVSRTRGFFSSDKGQ